MAKLLYSALMSLDGYIADEEGKFDWAEPDGEVHSFVNELVRPVGTYLYGRRMYDVLKVWETVDAGPDHIREFAEIWRAADKVVYSRTLEEVSTARTRLEREFDPAAVRSLKEEADGDLAIAGAALASQAFAAGLVDECHLFLAPIVVGAGNPGLPDRLRVPLELLDERRFGNGMVLLRYGVGS
jgi:dihydrofolate reductase